MAIAFAGLIVLIPPVLFGADWSIWAYRGLATLLIACPCALVISTPAAIASGLAAGARRGLLIKGGAALETLGKAVTIAFDKTGTVTVGKPQVTDVVAIEGGEQELLAKAAAVERGSSHPLGLAIVAAAEARNLNLPQTFGGSTAIPGKAVTARLREGFVSIGSPAMRRSLGRYLTSCRPASRHSRPRERRSPSFLSPSVSSASSPCETSHGRMRQRALHT